MGGVVGGGWGWNSVGWALMVATAMCFARCLPQLLDNLREAQRDTPMWLLRDSAACLSAMAERVSVVRVAKKAQPSLLSSTSDILKTVCVQALLKSPSLDSFPLLQFPEFVKLRTKLTW